MSRIPKTTSETGHDGGSVHLAEAPSSSAGHRFSRSLQFAVDGFARTVFSQRNMKIHVVCALSAALFGAVFPLAMPARTALLIAIALVLFAELLNTALEAVVDLLAPDYNRAAMIAKDAAAAGVLVFAALAVFIFADVVIESFSVIQAALPNLGIVWGLAPVVLCVEVAKLFMMRSRSSIWFAYCFVTLTMVAMVPVAVNGLFLVLAWSLTTATTYALVRPR